MWPGRRCLRGGSGSRWPAILPVAGQAVHASSFAEPAQNEHGLPEWAQLPRTTRRADEAAVRDPETGEVIHHRAWDIEHGSTSDQTDDLVVRPSCQGLHALSRPGRRCPTQVDTPRSTRFAEIISLRKPQLGCDLARPHFLVAQMESHGEHGVVRDAGAADGLAASPMVLPRRRADAWPSRVRCRAAKVRFAVSKTRCRAAFGGR